MGAAAGIFGTLLILLVLAGLLYLIRRWMQGPARVSEDVKLEGKTVVITGANTGIGKATAMDMSRRGAKVVILCSDMEKAEAAAAEVRDVTKGEVICHRLDLADLASVRECAEQLGTNHIGHFLLTNLLMPQLKKAAPSARIVNVSSMAHKPGRMNWDDLHYENTPYHRFTAYSQSKLANILFTKELARK